MKASYETNLSTQQTSKKESPWISDTDENCQRTEDHQSKTKKRKKIFSSLRFPKSARLRKRKDFLNCKKTSYQMEGKYFYLQILPNKSEKKLGITASSKFGNAVQRNRFKRQMREIFRINYSKLPYMHLHVIARKYAQKAPQSQLQTELLRLIQNICN